jgi:hypothetical protein
MFALMGYKQHGWTQFLIVCVLLAAVLIAVLRNVSSNVLLLILGANMSLIIKYYFARK